MQILFHANTCKYVYVSVCARRNLYAWNHARLNGALHHAKSVGHCLAVISLKPDASTGNCHADSQLINIIQ